MATVTYKDGIAILQLIIFPFLFAAAVFIWSRSGWRVGSTIWRAPSMLCLIRIAGGICTLLTIHWTNNTNIYIAEIVCEMIGIAPLIITYIGLLRQIDIDEIIPPRWTRIMTLAGLIGLILAIAGVSTANVSEGYTPGSLVKAAVGIFIALLALSGACGIWLYGKYKFNMKVFQKKLFIAILLSYPFQVVRIIYAAIGDYGHSANFSVLTTTNTAITIYLVMSVLMELAAIIIVLGLGVSAVRSPDFVKLHRHSSQDEEKPNTQY